MQLEVASELARVRDMKKQLAAVPKDAMLGAIPAYLHMIAERS